MAAEAGRSSHPFRRNRHQRRFHTLPVRSRMECTWNPGRCHGSGLLPDIRRRNRRTRRRRTLDQRNRARRCTGRPGRRVYVLLRRMCRPLPGRSHSRSGNGMCRWCRDLSRRSPSLLFRRSPPVSRYPRWCTHRRHRRNPGCRCGCSRSRECSRHRCRGYHRHSPSPNRRHRLPADKWCLSSRNSSRRRAVLL